ncbi:MAG: hypothetical protein GY838_20095, partial [bacterium]|nr:hypothetical protein [bacterium]
PALVWEMDCSQRSTGARDDNLVILLLFVGTNVLEEMLVDCGPLPVSMFRSSEVELLAEVTRRLDALGIEDWRRRTCGITTDSGSNFVLTMARAVRKAYCASIAVLPDPAHRAMHAVEDGVIPSDGYQGLYSLVVDLRAWLRCDKKRRMMARLLELIPEAGALLPHHADLGPRLVAMPKAHNIRWAAARLRELSVLWRSWPIFCLATLDMSLGRDRAACQWSDKDLEDARLLHDALADVSVWRLCGFVVDYLTLMDVLSHALQQRGLDTVLTHEAVRQCSRRLKTLAARVPDKVAARPGKEQALVSRPHKRSFQGIDVGGTDDPRKWRRSGRRSSAGRSPAWNRASARSRTGPGRRSATPP